MGGQPARSHLAARSKKAARRMFVSVVVERASDAATRTFLASGVAVRSQEPTTKSQHQRRYVLAMRVRLVLTECAAGIAATEHLHRRAAQRPASPRHTTAGPSSSMLHVNLRVPVPSCQTQHRSLRSFRHRSGPTPRSKPSREFSLAACGVFVLAGFLSRESAERGFVLCWQDLQRTQQHTLEALTQQVRLEASICLHAPRNQSVDVHSCRLTLVR